MLPSDRPISIFDCSHYFYYSFRVGFVPMDAHLVELMVILKHTFTRICIYMHFYETEIKFMAFSIPILNLDR